MISLDKVGFLVCGSRNIGEYSSKYKDENPHGGPHQAYRNVNHVAWFDICMHMIVRNIVKIEQKTNPDFTKDDIVIISGGAYGPDDLAFLWARQNKFIFIEMPALWDKHGKGAGYVRNAEMEQLAKYIFAAYDGVSRGTAHTIALAKKHKKKIKTINFVKKFPYQFQ